MPRIPEPRISFGDTRGTAVKPSLAWPTASAGARSPGVAGRDAWRRLMVLPRAQVVRLTTVGNRVTELELRVNDQQQFLRPSLISPDCTVVLAASTIEPTRLALDSLPSPATGANRMGSNLMAHL